VAAKLPEGQSALGFSLGIDEVKDGLRLGQVETAILDGAARKFTGLGRTETIDAAERLEKGRHNRPSPMAVKFRNVFTRVTGPAAEK